jgi:site-specific DNA recombinase
MPRLYRRLEELLDLIYLAERSDLKRIATTEGLGYDLATGEGIHEAVSAVNSAVLEARNDSDRQKRKKRAQARAGRFNGGSRPYGYEADGVTLWPGETAVIRELTRRILHLIRTGVRAPVREGTPVLTLVHDESEANATGQASAVGSSIGAG